jgi:ADP-ribosyl-[dinitrogen reductase] hydrolase
MAGHDETLTTRDRFRGALLGLAVGEALGAPADFLTAAQIEERYGVITEMLGGGCHDVAPGETTDATEMMLCLAESLADRRAFDPEDIMERYLAWFDGTPRGGGLNVRTVGGGFRSALCC